MIRPLRDQPRLTATVGTLAVGSLLVTYASRRWGVSPAYTPPLVTGEGVEVAGLTSPPQQLLILTVAVAVVAGLWALNRFTSFGLRLRATALDPYAAGLVGVNNNATSIAAWTIAGALAGVSAILIAPSTTFDVNFMTGLLLRGLAAALIGGLTSIGGAFAAGIVLGMVEAWIAYKTPVIGTTEVVLALFVIAMLLDPAPGPRAVELLMGTRRIGLAGGAVALTLVPLTFAEATVYKLGLVLIVIVGAIGLHVLVNWTGELSLAHATIIGFPAFVVAKLSADHGISPLYLLPVGVLAGALVGAVVGLPALRARGLQVALVTLAAGVAIDRYFFTKAWFAGRGRRRPGRPAPARAARVRTSRSLYPVLVVLVLARWRSRRGCSTARRSGEDSTG